MKRITESCDDPLLLLVVRNRFPESGVEMGQILDTSAAAAFDKYEWKGSKEGSKEGAWLGSSDVNKEFVPSIM